MQHPEYVYYMAIGLMATAEGVSRVLHRDLFGRVVWVLLAVFVASYAAYALGAAMPRAQLAFHVLGFIVGLAASKHLPGHIAAALFLPMVSVDLARIAELISAANWWWAIYYLALGQLVVLGVGSSAHRLGRWFRAWAARAIAGMEMRAHAWSG
jgi:hypothetical protein